MVGIAERHAHQRAGLAAQVQFGATRGFKQGDRGDVLGATTVGSQIGHFFGLSDGFAAVCGHAYETASGFPGG